MTQFTFEDWLSQASMNDVWFIYNFEEGHPDNQPTKICFGDQLGHIFKKVRRALVFQFSAKRWFGDLLSQIKIDVAKTASYDVVDVIFEGEGENAESFEEGLKLDIQALYHMVGMVKDTFPILDDKNATLLFSYFESDSYRKMEGLNQSEVLQRVYFILTHPIFFDLEEIKCFIYLVYYLYIRDEQHCHNHIELELEGWIAAIAKKHSTKQAHTVVTKCLAFNEDQAFWKSPWTVVKFMRDLLLRQNCECHTANMPLKDITWAIVYNLGDIGVLPELHSKLMNAFGQNNLTHALTLGGSLIDYLNELPFGLRYKIAS